MQLLVLPLCRNMFNFVGGTVEFGSDEPWTCEGINELINLASLGVRSGCVMSKNRVTDGVKLRAGPTCVDEFAMICSLFVNEEGRNFPEADKRLARSRE